MEYNRISSGLLEELQNICGPENVLTDSADLESYSRDETEDLKFYPEVVVKPATVEEISRVLSFCYENIIPVTPRAAGTGLSGGALPIYGGVVLSIEKLNKILEIDEDNLQVTVEPGVITQVLQEAVMEKDLFYPPDPASRGSCFIGGNIAENSGGPKAVKYGVVKDYVINLEAVLPNGDIIWTGANVLKNSTGYNLTQLLVGSEGTLAVVTKIVLKLIPLPKHDLTMLVPFQTLEGACASVAAIFKAGITPSGLEFMERDAIDWAVDFVGDMNIEISDSTMAHLLIEVDGNDLNQLASECEQIAVVLEGFDAGEILFADNAKQKADLWKLRRSVAEAVKAHSIYKEEDTVVPRARLPQLVNGVKQIGHKFGFKSVCYGHAGDGNLHVNIIKGDLSDNDWDETVSKGIREIFELVKQLGGTLSGEHGIGLVQKDYMDIVFSKIELELMWDIKKVFDPKNILNPGKILA